MIILSRKLHGCDSIIAYYRHKCKCYVGILQGVCKPCIKAIYGNWQTIRMVLTKGKIVNWKKGKIWSKFRNHLFQKYNVNSLTNLIFRNICVQLSKLYKVKQSVDKLTNSHIKGMKPIRVSQGVSLFTYLPTFENCHLLSIFFTYARDHILVLFTF